MPPSPRPHPGIGDRRESYPSAHVTAVVSPRLEKMKKKTATESASEDSYELSPVTRKPVTSKAYGLRVEVKEARDLIAGRRHTGVYFCVSVLEGPPSESFVYHTGESDLSSHMLRSSLGDNESAHKLGIKPQFTSQICPNQSHIARWREPVSLSSVSSLSLHDHPGSTSQASEQQVNLSGQVVSLLVTVRLVSGSGTPDKFCGQVFVTGVCPGVGIDSWYSVKDAEGRQMHSERGDPSFMHMSVDYVLVHAHERQPMQKKGPHSPHHSNVIFTPPHSPQQKFTTGTPRDEFNSILTPRSHPIQHMPSLDTYYVREFNVLRSSGSAEACPHVGIGASFRFDRDGNAVVACIFENGSIAKMRSNQTIQVGDLISHVDGDAVQGKTLTQVHHPFLFFAHTCVLPSPPPTLQISANTLLLCATLCHSLDVCLHNRLWIRSADSQAQVW